MANFPTIAKPGMQEQWSTNDRPSMSIVEKRRKEVGQGCSAMTAMNSRNHRPRSWNSVNSDIPVIHYTIAALNGDKAHWAKRTTNSENGFEAHEYPNQLCKSRSCNHSFNCLFMTSKP